MKQTRIMMGMPITVEITDKAANQKAIDEVFSYFEYVDNKFSTYKDASEISKINRKEINKDEWSDDMKTIFSLSEKTKSETMGYFDIQSPKGVYDPSGIVKGWAIYEAAKILDNLGFKNFYIEAGGDIEVRGKNEKGDDWTIGIRNPFKTDEIVKAVKIKNQGMATSGIYERGQHIYNPKASNKPLTEIVSLTVIGPNIYEADRFATAAFAMGREGINFIGNLPGFHAYMIDKNGQATMTADFEKYVI